MDLKKRAQKLKTDIPAVFIALKHKRTPVSAKIFAMMTVIYALSPIDFIPDFIPVLGLLDDLLILPGLVALTVKLIPEDVFEECRKDAEKLWTGGKPNKWYYALPIVLIWLIVIFFIVKAVWQ
jgi:uncharacterized membrane protein YkvA (DUF1232 family)